MKLLRVGEVGLERPALIDEGGRIRDLSAHIDDLAGATISPSSLAKLRDIPPESLPFVAGEPRVGCPLGHVGKIIAVGLNYRDHAQESGMALPAEPLLFMKATSSINGPFDPVILPPNSTKGDWEVELAIVIGKAASYVSEDSALDHVAGYMICNDISERTLQLERGGQWIKGKSNDTFCPLGPWLVTADEVPDPQSLNMWLDLNGTRMQDGSTANMIFGVAFIVAYISEFMSLQPGDVITTGTPAGVGMGRSPQRFLADGDVLQLGIDGLGRQSQVCKTATAA